MTRAARAEGTKIEMPKAAESPTTLRINLAKNKQMVGHKIGDTVHFHGHGKVTSINQDDYTNHMGIDVHSIKKVKRPSVQSVEGVDDLRD